ncbi:MAG: c-type cytochrome [Gammaproteobacteria bacterium]|nr:c-type cytochrome [Gammaproteobacteria bacterium]
MASIITAAPLTSWAFPWDKDMRDQPSVKPQETVVHTNASSVPVDGKREILPPPKDLKEIVFARLEAGALGNPNDPSEESLARGQELYEIHCASCHGDEGRGDGPVGKKYVPTPMDLTILYVQNQPDGQLYYTITNGGLIMPHYRDSIASSGRWDIVNYIKEVLGNSETLSQNE